MKESQKQSDATSTPVQSGDQSKKIEHRGAKQDQGESCCPTSSFEQLTGPEGALQMSPKVKAQPTKGPFDALKGKQAGHQQSKQDSGDKEHSLTPMKARPARNSKNK